MRTIKTIARISGISLLIAISTQAQAGPIEQSELMANNCEMLTKFAVGEISRGTKAMGRELVTRIAIKNYQRGTDDETFSRFKKYFIISVNTAFDYMPDDTFSDNWDSRKSKAIEVAREKCKLESLSSEY